MISEVWRFHMRLNAILRISIDWYKLMNALSIQPDDLTAENAHKHALFWFRRDLRTFDNAGFYAALTAAKKVSCVFVFDKEILDLLEDKADKRVDFIWASVLEVKQALQDAGGDLIVLYDHASQAIPNLAATLKVDAVFTNTDYEPQAIARDAHVAAACAKNGIDFHTVKDTVVFEKREVLTQTAGIYSVFTPYKNAWLKRLRDADLAVRPSENHLKKVAKAPAQFAAMPSMSSMGFQATDIAKFVTPGMTGAAKLVEDFIPRMDGYHEARNYPSVKGVSYLSVHNRFGTVSIRQLARIAYAETLRKTNEGAQIWLNELIWRDFYFQIMFHSPHAATSCFKPMYDALKWENSPALFAAWCEARTGYPIIDAAMRQLNQTGYMHNRLRMIVASFLTKDLLVSWQWGEKYFAEKLIDFDLTANNGGWQWAASTGCDAQPYFRIFNPISQSEKFDTAGKFIRRYMPELKNIPDKFIHAPWTLPPLEQTARGCVIGKDYPAPVVDHATQRDKALAMYKVAR